MCYPRILWLLAIFVFTQVTLHSKSSEQLPSGLQAAYQKARHQIEVIEEKGKLTCWRALNTGNNLKVDFDGKGIVARSLKDDWRLSIELTQLGASGQLKPVNNPSVQINDNRLTYDRGTIREWYINDPKGLEQGFTPNKPLTKERLVLEFALGGDVKSQLIDKGKVLQLITPQGKKLRYEGIKAWDAKGRDLNATLGLKENTLQLQVAVTGAVYPITIDPWLVEDHKLLLPAEGEFGYSVAISGDTVVMGAIGGAYVFDLSSDTTTSQGVGYTGSFRKMKVAMR